MNRGDFPENAGNQKLSCTAAFVMCDHRFLGPTLGTGPGTQHGEHGSCGMQANFSLPLERDVKYGFPRF